MVLVGIDLGVSRPGGEIVSHYTTDARQFGTCSIVHDVGPTYFAMNNQNSKG